MAAEPLIELRETSRVLSPETFELRLTLPDVFVDERGRPYPAAVTLVRLDGRWPAERASAAISCIPGRHGADGSGLRLEGGRLTGRLRLIIKPCFWENSSRPADGKEHALELDLDGAVAEAAGEAAAWTLEGTLRGQRLLNSGQVEDQPAAGEVRGEFRPPVRPGGWNRGVYEDGLRLALDMGKRRVNWNHHECAVYEFDRPRDLSAFSGLRLRIARPADEIARLPGVSATVWLREEDGSWYYVKGAVPLVDPENEAVLLFEDFAEAEFVAPGNHMDEDYVLDLGAVSHLAVGVVNPLGVGEVAFAVKGIDLVRCEARPAEPVRAAVTGRMLSVNGHELIPAGVFGGYAPELPQEFRPGCQRHLAHGPNIPAKGRTEIFHVDCWYDRYNSAELLGRGDWDKRLAEAGRRYALRAREADYQAHLEFWNEPYLNWAKPPRGRNYGPAFYDQARAAEGQPVIARHTAMRIPYLAWRSASDGWEVYDPTQFTYWSGRANGFMYDRMLLAVATAVKEANPDVRVIAGWGFRWNEDHWAAWDMLYRPTIDRCISYIDGIHEHHYQGDTTAMNGAYEVLVAYAKTRYDKWLYCYNTETNDLLDAPARGAVDTPQKAAKATQYRRMVYNLRDILYSLRESPDKFVARTVIHCVRAGTENYTRVAYGLMKDLRGRLVETETGDPQVWCVAGVDGTDPRAMPPDPQAPPTLVVIVFNDHRVPREVDLRVAAPAGTKFAGGRVERTAVDKATFQIGLEESGAGVAAGQTEARFRFTLQERAAWKVALPLTGALPAGPEVRRRQFFSPDILGKVSRGEPFRTSVRLDPDALGKAARAWLRLVVEDVAPGEGTVTVGAAGGGEGLVLALPKAWTADNVTRIVELPLDPAVLAAAVDLEFRLNPGNHLGYQVDMASIVLETRPASPGGSPASPGRSPAGD